MSENNTNSKIEELMKPDFDSYNNNVDNVIKEVKLIHNLVNMKYDLDAKLKKLRAKTNSTGGQNTKSEEQIIEILQRLEYGAKDLAEESNSKQERYKVPSLRFADITKSNYSEIASELKEKEQYILETFGIKVLLVENLDIRNNPSEKFYIKLVDDNGNYTLIDLLKYQKDIYDFTVDEEENIKNELIKLSGVYDVQSIEASRAIADYISIALGYKQTFHYEYSLVGWDKITFNKKKYSIFKYNKIYSNIKPELKGFCGQDWAEAISTNDKYTKENKKQWNEFMALTFNDSVIADIILCAGVSGVVRQVITYTKETNINMNIVAEKSSGKSTMQHLVLSFFGNPEKLEGSFIDTENAVDELRAERAIVPYILDERLLKVESDSDKKKALNILLSIFREYEGKVKSKLGTKYNNSNAVAYGAIISSSVESIIEQINKVYKDEDDNTRDLGQYRRFIEINAKKKDLFKDGEHAKAADNLAYSRYGFGISQMINYMFALMKYEKVIEYLLDQEVSVGNALNIVDLFIDKGNGINKNISKSELLMFDVLFGSNKEKILDDIEELEITEGNDSEIFNKLFTSMVNEVNEKTKEYKQGMYFDEMESSVQRFALLILTGYLLEHSIGDGSEDIQFNMDMNAVLNYLINNLFVKLYEAKIIEDNKIKVEASAKDVIDLYDWCVANQDYFYIPNKNNRHINDNYIGRYKKKGDMLEVLIPDNREITWNIILGNLDSNGDDILQFQYNHKLLNNKEATKEFTSSLLSQNRFITISKKTVQITSTGKRGKVYGFNISEIEKARIELNGQEESKNETN